MPRVLTYLAILCILPLTSQAQTKAPAALQGVWKVAEVEVTGAGAYVNSTPQAGLLFFTTKYYSNMSVQGRGPRPAVETAKDPAHLTDAEKLARFAQWSLFTANAGTYEVKGDTVMYRPIVAKNESVMAQGPTAVRFKVDGNTLWFIQQRAGQPGETRTKLTRVD
jgi:hypothetical protein